MSGAYVKLLSVVEIQVKPEILTLNYHWNETEQD